MLHRKPKHNRRAAPLWRKLVIVSVIAVVIVGGVLSALALTHTFPFNNKSDDADTDATTANSETKGETGVGDSKTQIPDSQDGTWSSDSKDPQNSTDQKTGQKPRMPDGNFVSSHRVSLGGNPTLQSSCITNPGITCQVLFIKDGITKTLEVKKTDAGGGAYWTWKPKDIGLTVGSWKIQVKATVGNESSTAEDALQLEVTP